MLACSYCGMKINDRLLIDWKIGKRIDGVEIKASNRHELHMKYQRDYEPVDTRV